jgi:hypothetical protein
MLIAKGFLYFKTICGNLDFTVKHQRLNDTFHPEISDFVNSFAHHLLIMFDFNFKKRLRSVTKEIFAVGSDKILSQLTHISSQISIEINYSMKK